MLVEKLKALKGLVKIWNKDVFSMLGMNKTEALGQIATRDAVESSRALTLEELGLREEAKGKFKSWALKEEIF